MAVSKGLRLWNCLRPVFRQSPKFDSVVGRSQMRSDVKPWITRKASVVKKIDWFRQCACSISFLLLRPPLRGGKHSICLSTLRMEGLGSDWSRVKLELKLFFLTWMHSWYPPRRWSLRRLCYSRALSHVLGAYSCNGEMFSGENGDDWDRFMWTLPFLIDLCGCFPFFHIWRPLLWWVWRVFF